MSLISGDNAGDPVDIGGRMCEEKASLPMCSQMERKYAILAVIGVLCLVESLLRNTNQEQVLYYTGNLLRLPLGN